MSEDTERVTARYIYAGRRQNRQGKLLHAWIDTDGDPDELLFYTKLAATVVGGIYTVEVTPEKESVYPSTLAYSGERVDEDRRTVLQATHMAAMARDATGKLERNHGRQNEVKELCAPLRDLVRKQVGSANRAALLAYIQSEVSR